MKVLNVGAGMSDISKQFPEAEIVRMDIDKKVRPDVVHDIEKPMPKSQRGVYEVVYASHILEHISWKKVNQVIDNLMSCLVDWGELWVLVPSLEWVGMELMKDDPSYAVLGALYGSQDAKGQFHKSGFTMMWLRKLFQGHGLVVRKAFQRYFGISLDGGEDVAVGEIVIIGAKMPKEMIKEKDDGTGKT